MREILGRWLSLLLSIAVLGGVSFLVQDNLDPYYFTILIGCGIYAILAVSLNLINGITGQFSIGHAGFYGVGAYMGAAWTMIWQPTLVKSMPFLQTGSLAGNSLNLVITLVLAALGAAFAGWLVGLPSLRLRGDYLAIVTLGFGEVIRIFLLNIEVLGGASGLSSIPTLAKQHNTAVFWVFGVLILSILFSRNLMQSVQGLKWMAVREDEIAADAMGVNTTKVKVTSFVIGAAFAGMAGTLFAHFYTGISPDNFDMNISILITTMVVLGGTGSVTGSVVAAFLLTAAPEFLRIDWFKDYRMTIYSTLLVVLMLTRPQGIFGHKELSLRRLIPFRKRRREEKSI